jgi:hypothetical protein
MFRQYDWKTVCLKPSAKMLISYGNIAKQGVDKLMILLRKAIEKLQKYD